MIPPAPVAIPESPDRWLHALTRVLARVTAGSDRQDVPAALISGIVEELGVSLAAIWLYPEVVEATDVDYEDLFNTHRKSMHLAIKKAISGEPSIEWLLENQDKIVHSYHQKGLDGKL